MSILITGAAGFIASHLIPVLESQDWSIVAAMRQPKTFSQTVEKRVIEKINGDTDWTQALKGIDIVIHLAGRAHILQEQASDPEAEFFAVNTAGTANLVKQSIAAGVKHFIFISSIGAIANQSQEPLTETTPCQPNTPYGRSKLQAEKGLMELASSSSMDWTIFRPTLVYGKGNPGNMERLIKLVNSGLPLPLGLVKNRRSFVYVGNLVDAIALSLIHPQGKNQIFNISDGEDISTPELISKIAQNLGKPCKLLPVPPSLLKIAGYVGDLGQKATKKNLPINTAIVERLLGSLVADSSKIQTTLNWQSPYTLDQGLARLLAA
jgi:nucleoside-diphosphate-sugar epimerase